MSWQQSFFLCVLTVCITIAFCHSIYVFFQPNEDDPPKRRPIRDNTGPK